MGFAGYDQDDGTPIYTRGDYEITVEVSMVKRITVEADPNDDDSITKAVEEWINDNVSEDIDDWDYEVEDVTEV